jgi:hypothetical protein
MQTRMKIALGLSFLMGFIIARINLLLALWIGFVIIYLGITHYPHKEKPKKEEKETVALSPEWEKEHEKKKEKDKEVGIV